MRLAREAGLASRVPAVMIRTPGMLVGLISVPSAVSPWSLRKSEMPAPCGTSKWLCASGERRSASSTRTLRPVSAKLAARLAALVDLPSAG